jgi:hypothetical protein
MRTLYKISKENIFFFKGLEISLLLFLALFLGTTSVPAQQTYYNFPYDYGSYSNSYTFNSWSSPLSTNYQDYSGYGQSNWGLWPQSNSLSFNSSWSTTPVYSLLGSSSYYAPSPYSPPASDENFSLLRTSSNIQSSNIQSSFSDILSKLPDLSSIVFNPTTQTYNAPGWISYISTFQFDTVIGKTVNGRSATLHLSPDLGPFLYSDGTVATKDGTSQVKTITIEDDGKAFTFKPGELFMIALPIYDNDAYPEFPPDQTNFPGNGGWSRSGSGSGFSNWNYQDRYIYGIEPISFGLGEDEQGNLIQDNLFKTITGSGFIPKELVFNYYSNYNPDGLNLAKDTFRVTIKVE